MPQKIQPLALQELAIKQLGAWVRAFGEALVKSEWFYDCQNREEQDAMLNHVVMWINETLYANVPWYLYDEMVMHVLLAIADLMNGGERRFRFDPRQNNYVTNRMVSFDLVKVVIHSHLQYINLSCWPNSIRQVLVQNLSKLAGLKRLSIKNGLGQYRTHNFFLRWIRYSLNDLSNLVSLSLCYHCSDSTITVVGNSCPLLQILDITYSRSVTDKSIPHLINCTNLREVKLYQTSISVQGVKELLSALPRIQDIGRCDEFAKVLKQIHEENLGLLNLKILHCRYMTNDHFKLLIVHCPNIVSLAIYHDDIQADFTILSSLANLKELKILNCSFSTDKVKDLLEIRGANLSWLHLEQVKEIDLNAIVCISHFCQNLKSLILYHCEVWQHIPVYFGISDIKPFLNLERFHCFSSYALKYIEFILSHCKKIRVLELGSLNDISDTTMCRLLMTNPMKHLEELILFSHDITMQTVSLIMSHCEHLRFLSGLERCRISFKELHEFKCFIKDNNINLVVKGTFRNNNNIRVAPGLSNER